jgi:bleomycin hydrolase
MKNFILTVVFFGVFFTGLYSQTNFRTRAIIRKDSSEFYQKMMAEIKQFNDKDVAKKKSFKVDFTGYTFPTDKKLYKEYWHNNPINQGMTGTCWSFSTTSYFESEVYRLINQKVKLSEMYTVYWEYVEKAKRFVKERGNSAFEEGSEANALKRIWLKYGVVPEDNYTGKLPGQKHHDHSKMIKEMKDFLESVKTTNNWNEDEVVTTIKSILNYYMGVPPVEIEVNGEKLSPKEYLDKVLKLKMDDYVDFISLMEIPFYKQGEYKVQDNWWHDSSYYSLPVDEWINAFKNALRNGYTMAIGGDVSEPGYDSHAKVGIIPTFDIPSEYIDDYARELRFNNGTTSDDHGLHAVGYFEKEGKYWFLIKDSGAGAQNLEPKGYYFYNEDYVKLKMIDFMVHKDAVKDILAKFKVN